MEPLLMNRLWVWAPAGLALAFAFSNGFRDSSTIVATVVSTRALSPTAAYGLCALFEFLGALLIGHAITATVGAVVVSQGFAPAQAEVSRVLACGLGAAIGWGILSWWRAWPTSNSQAVVGGLAGASWVVWGPGHSLDSVKLTVLVVLVASPMIGFLISTGLTSLFRQAGAWMTPRAKPFTQALHVLACLAVSTAHGSNDGQMAVALFALAVAGAATGAPRTAHAPLLVRLPVAIALSGGVLLSGRRILRKLGTKFYRIRDMQGLGAQVSATGTLLTCSIAGFPASTTQVVSGSIVGAGVAKNPRSVRWLIVRDIALSWVFTVPATALLGAVLVRALAAGGRT